MRTARLLALRVLLVGLTLQASAAADELAPATREILKQYAEEKAEADKKVNEEIAKIKLEAAEKIRTVKLKAIRQLMMLQDRYCKAGRLDEALAVRDRIRLLRNDAAEAETISGYLNSANAKVGHVKYLRVTGKKTASIYGTDVYTSDSHVGAAAIHCGILKDGETGVVKVTVLPGQTNYPASTRHGVTSYGYGSWGLSYKVEAVPMTQLVRTNSKVRSDPGTLHAYRGMNGHSFLFEVTGAKNGTIYGSGVYTDDSPLATAAVHAGFVEDGKKGVVKVTIMGAQSGYRGSEQHGVTSEKWGGGAGSYKLEAANAGKVDEKDDKE